VELLSEYLAEQFAARILPEKLTLPCICHISYLIAALSPGKVNSPCLCNISDFKLCKTSLVALPSEYFAEQFAALFQEKVTLPCICHISDLKLW
jgi:hypothetical protein